MITFPRLIPRIFVVSALLALLPRTGATPETNLSDRPARALARAGRLEVQAAGPYVGKGAFQIQVSTKLGRPSFVLPDGTWAYSNYLVEESAAHGTLMIRFAGGRVSKLELVTAETVAPLRFDPLQQLAAGRNKSPR